MGRTVHEDAATALLDDILTNPDAAATFAAIRSRLRDDPHGWFRDGIVETVGQLHGRAPADWPVEQAAAFTLIHARLMAGSCAHFRIALGVTPGPDHDRTGNAALLTRLPPPFSAWLDSAQRGADRDGTLTWKHAVAVDGCSTGTALLSCEAPAPITTLRRIAAQTVPLEVGSTMPSRTLLHLNQSGAVARWPYDSPDIHVIVNLHPGNDDD